MLGRKSAFFLLHVKFGREASPLNFDYLTESQFVDPVFWLIEVVNLVCLFTQLPWDFKSCCPILKRHVLLEI